MCEKAQNKNSRSQNVCRRARRRLTLRSHRTRSITYTGPAKTQLDAKFASLSRVTRWPMSVELLPPSLSPGVLSSYRDGGSLVSLCVKETARQEVNEPDRFVSTVVLQPFMCVCVFVQRSFVRESERKNANVPRTKLMRAK
ncbi:hypothetical protein F2P81_025226 [Scophthalmus maximus]|uniref:Uncharacterized protein n=1 Tax=Scophthalmus maximus TaxID=52904 RepID=A0A6A4RTA8_SCOMX|nr:hypothetical protein F2P81_025226 [Scophthalmus maximus]